MDLRLLITTCSITTIESAAVVEERQRGKGEVEKLHITEVALRASEKRFRLACSKPGMRWLAGI